MFKQLSNQLFLGNTLGDWGGAVVIIFGGFVIARIARVFLVKKLKRWTKTTSTNWDDYIVEAVDQSLIPLFICTVIYNVVKTLNIPAQAGKWAHAAFLTVVAFFLIKMVSKAVKKLVRLFVKKQGAGIEKEKQASGLIIIVNGILWLLAAIFLIDNLGYNVTTLIAGLGIGGIAIALAAQTILGDLFSYFVIFFDRPFEIDDFITVGDKAGVVEYIGIKTTRIRALGGEQIVCSNTDLTNARVHNYKRLVKRRILFNLGVAYQTPHSLLSEIPVLVRDIIHSAGNADFDRGHFSAYGDSSLDFEFVYYVQSPDYNTYMDKQQEIYLNIFKTFEEKGIEFAYPTQTLFIPKVNC